MRQRAIILSLFLLAAVPHLGAGDPPPEQQQTIDHLSSLLERAVPTATVKVLAGNDHAIILAGTVSHSEDLETILMIARNFRGENNGAIINALRVGSVAQVQVDVVIYRVDRAGLEQADPDWHRCYVERFWKLRTVNDTARQECKTFLQDLRDARLAGLVREAHLVTLVGRPACYYSGGEAAVPRVSGFGGGSADLEWINTGSSLEFLPVRLPDGRFSVNLSFNTRFTRESDDPTFVQFLDVVLESGQAIVVGMPAAQLERQEPAAGKAQPESQHDLVLLATVHEVKEQATVEPLEKFLESILEHPR